MSDEENKTPEKSTGDIIHTIAKAGLGSIPIVGAAASELFVALVTPPLERRRNAWMDMVGERLHYIETTHGIRIEELKSDETFISTVMQASQIAVRTHQQEKLDALLNAIEYAALPGAPEEVLQQIFLSYVDTFTVLHIKILSRLNSVRFGGSALDVIREDFPGMDSQKYLYTLVWQDLMTKGLVYVGQEAKFVEVGRTSTGNEFIGFISERASAKESA